MKKWLVIAVTVVCMGNGAGRRREFYVHLPMDSREDLIRLVEQGFDVAGVNIPEKRVTIVVSEEQLPELRGLRVLSREAIFAPDDGFKTHAEVEAILKEAESRYPELVRLESVGKSIEGRDIWAINLSAHFVDIGKPKQKILIDAMHHAREVMTTEVALDIVEYLTSNYPTDPKVKNWMEKYEVWVVPMVNPDGNNKVWSSSSMWRKNTRGGHGVDVNRNYPYGWNTCNGSSGSTFSDTYRGSAPGSEPETQVLMNLATRLNPKFNISYHSYSEIVIYPFGCRPQKLQEPDASTYIGYGKELAGRLKRDSGSGSYDYGTSYELLYNVDGGSVDWMYNSAKIMSFVIEINSDSQGFQPDYDQWRDITVKRQREGWQYLLDSMDGAGIK